MTVNLQFANLEPHVQDKFYAVAAKDPNGASAVEWFEHLVPEPLQDSSAETEVFMDGGTVTQEVYVYDQGRAGGHWETVEHEIGDRDISRMEAGANGGEYTHDNTIMEDSSVNRSRGGEDMTSAELETAEAAEAVDTQLIDGAEIVDSTIEVTGNATETAGGVAEVLGAAGDVLTDVAAPAIGAYLVGKTVAKKCKTTKDKIGYGSLAGGLGALICCTPPGQAALGLYGLYSVAKLSIKATSFVMKNV